MEEKTIAQEDFFGESSPEGEAMASKGDFFEAGDSEEGAGIFKQGSEEEAGEETDGETDRDGFEEALEETDEVEAGEATIPVRFNHREMKIPVSEAVPLIQKGLNYDRVLSERDRLRSYTAPRGDGALRDEFDAFSKNFPEAAARPEDIPGSVWEDFRRGMPLAEAWLKSENSRVTAMLEAERARAQTRARTTRSARGRGAGFSFDGFLEGFSHG